MQLVVVGVTFEVVDGLLPVGGQNVLVLPIKSLMDVCPWSSVQFCGRISLGRQLTIASLMSVGSCSPFVVRRGGWGKQTAALAPIVCHTVSFWMVA